MRRTTAERGVVALRVLWIVLMVFLGALIVTGQISGFATVLYGVVALGVTFAERALRRNVRQS
jgi:hypothetical protein